MFSTSMPNESSQRSNSLRNGQWSPHLGCQNQLMSFKVNACMWLCYKSQTLTRVSMVLMQEVTSCEVSSENWWAHIESFIHSCLFSQNTMNLPSDKVKILSRYDNEKKWDLICDQVGLCSPSALTRLVVVTQTESWEHVSRDTKHQEPPACWRAH